MKRRRYLVKKQADVLPIDELFQQTNKKQEIFFLFL
jgi:hypothetical protein